MNQLRMIIILTSFLFLFAIAWSGVSRLYAAPAPQVSVLSLFKTIEGRLTRLEERLVWRDTLEALNCEYVELRNPEREKFFNGIRIYDNYETTLACLAHRNPPGHIYATPSGHVNPPGFEHYTNVDFPAMIQKAELHVHDGYEPHFHPPGSPHVHPDEDDHSESYE